MARRVRQASRVASKFYFSLRSHGCSISLKVDMSKPLLSKAKDRDIVRDKENGQFLQLFGETASERHAAQLVPGGKMEPIHLDPDRHELVKPPFTQGQAVMIPSTGQGGRVTGHEQVGSNLLNLVETVDGDSLCLPSDALTKGGRQVPALERRRDEAERVDENNRLGLDDDGVPLPNL